eukprot:comp21373_c0_seq1/m.29379 comp21373_c0_seq1/g.29379  ORF comp21373_c0_seq1/g.29379 comp21373_c0_seq1/m.29379 type:complete len:410 (-) comp21373_c0_seq1:488-1717(-)
MLKLKALKSKAQEMLRREHQQSAQAQPDPKGTQCASPPPGLHPDMVAEVPAESQTIDIDSATSSSDEEASVPRPVNVHRFYEWAYRPASAAQEYTILRTINVGSTGKVQLAHHELTGKHVALKIMKKPKAAYMKYLHREASVQRQLSHRNICRLYDVIDTPHHFVLVQEYLSGGDLFDLVPPNEGCSELRALQYLVQITAAVAHMHARGVVHRDIKPENCVSDEHGVLKLIDFGAASDLCAEPTPAGTVPYMAPEMHSDPEGKEGWDFKAIDIWALGVVYFTLLTGRFPWALACTANSPEYRQYVANDISHRYPWHNLSPSAMHVLRKILHPDPSRRISAPQLQTLLASTIRKLQQFEITAPAPPETPLLKQKLSVTVQIDRKLIRECVPQTKTPRMPHHAMPLCVQGA